MLYDFLLNLSASFTYDLFQTSITRLRNGAFGDAEQQAMSRIYEHAFTGMLKAMAPNNDHDIFMHLDSVLHPLLCSLDVSNRLIDIALVEDYKPSIANLRTHFELASRELGCDLASLVSIQADLDAGLAAFIQTLIVELREESETSGSPLHNRVVVRQLDTLSNQQKEITDLVRQLLAGQPESAERLRKIEGQQQEILVALEHALGHIVKIDGDVSGSIIVVGDNNRVLLDGGYFAGLWKETGLTNPEALVPQYLGIVAKIYTPLYFPLGHLSQPIPLSEVYVDLPIVKPATDEAALRPPVPGQRLSGELIRRVDHLLQRSERSALVGILGTGKTTTLRYLTWVYAQRPKGKYYWRGDSLVPFYANLRDLAEHWTKTERVTPEQFVQSLAKGVSNAMGGAFSARSTEIILHRALEMGNALVLLDALDEFRASDQNRSEFITALQNLWLASDLCTNNHILLTSRPYGFLNPLGFGQYSLQDLDNAEYLVYQLGGAILKRSPANLAEDTIEAWLQILSEAVTQPRFRQFSSSFYITLMVYLGTSEETAEKSIELLVDIKRPADPYRFFLRKTIDWEKKKGNEPGVDHDTALLVLGYTAYNTFVEFFDIPQALQVSKKEVASVQEFWKRTGLLWEDNVGTLGFRHSGFQAFGVALSLTDMMLHTKEDKVNELWHRHKWDVEWKLILELYMSLRGEKYYDRAETPDI